MVAFAKKYDRAGNMTADGTLKYKYDAWNRQTYVSLADDTPVASYVYDAINRRIGKNILIGGVHLAQPQFYYNDKWQLLESREVAFNGSTLSSEQYVWSRSYIDSPIVRFSQSYFPTQSSHAIYYTTDANRNVTAIVNASGAVVERYIYDPYGKATICTADWTPNHATGYIPLGIRYNDGGFSAYGNEIMYCGYYYDFETSQNDSIEIGTGGNYLARNRYYSTIIAGWFTRDPIQADVNLYRYCGNNPVLLTDPSGLAWWNPGGAVGNWLGNKCYGNKDCPPPYNNGRSVGDYYDSRVSCKDCQKNSFAAEKKCLESITEKAAGLVLQR